MEHYSNDIIQRIAMKLLKELPLDEAEDKTWKEIQDEPEIRQCMENGIMDNLIVYKKIELLSWEQFQRKLGIILPSEILQSTRNFSWYLKAAAILIGAFITAWYLFPEKTIEIPETATVHKMETSAVKTARLITADQRQIPLKKQPADLHFQQPGQAVFIDSTGFLRFMLAGNPDNTRHNLVLTAPGVTTTFRLSDGTLVTLNTGSELKIPLSFAHSNRTVELKGEAYFEVKGNSRYPFIVKAGGIEQKVLGTGFIVTAYNNDSMITTTLLNGKLAVQAGKHKLELNKGEQSQVRVGTDQLKKTVRPDIEYATAWLSDYFQQRDEARVLLSDLLRRVERWYDVKIIIDDELQNEELAIGKIKRSTPVDSVLYRLSVPGGFRFKKQNDDFVIEKY